VTENHVVGHPQPAPERPGFRLDDQIVLDRHSFSCAAIASINGPFEC
jgi:hypothetical protein